MLVMILPFTMPNRHHKRKLVISVLLIRMTIFIALAMYKPLVIVFYAVSYMLFLTVMRFMDTHQHTYEIFETLPLTPKSMVGYTLGTVPQTSSGSVSPSVVNSSTPGKSDSKRSLSHFRYSRSQAGKVPYSFSIWTRGKRLHVDTSQFTSHAL